MTILNVLSVLTLVFILSLPRTYCRKLKLGAYVSCSRLHSQEGLETGFELEVPQNQPLVSAIGESEFSSQGSAHGEHDLDLIDAPLLSCQLL